MRDTCRRNDGVLPVRRTPCPAGIYAAIEAAPSIDRRGGNGWRAPRRHIGRDGRRRTCDERSNAEQKASHPECLQFETFLSKNAEDLLSLWAAPLRAR